MTYEFRYLMQLLGSASTGKPANPPDRELDWSRVFELTQEQMLDELIWYALKTNAALKCSEDNFLSVVPDPLPAIITDSAARSMIVSLLEKMESEGIHSVVVKGMSVADGYASPEARISSDTDILIAPEDEAKAQRFLADNGFRVESRWDNGHHFSAHHPLMGLLEVHIQLYDDIAEDVWFADVTAEELICQQHKKICTSDGVYYTLGDTDHLIFIILHMIKHFILCGMSLRMMTDTAVFMSSKKASLDFGRMWSVMKKLRYDGFLSSVLWAMVEYCGFSADDFPGIGAFEREKVELILSDVEKGGWLGKNDYSARKESWQEYSRQLFVKRKSNISYHLYMLNWQNTLKLKTFFPPKERLVKDYPVLNRFPLLIPFIWLHRIIFKSIPRYIKAKEKIIFNENSVSAESKERVNMFRTLGML
ncbi:MAG: nucleotidyltransferase family protein [Clostridia bacterium]|nr:nucleotidyltransferase family protein [Clostridia bacterium]